MATAVRTKTTVEGPNFLQLGMYVGGFTLPEGDYCIFFNVIMFDGTGAKKVPPRLGVMATCHSLTDPAAEPRDQFYSMGTNADKSWLPNATGKGLAAVPGAPSTTLPMNTNWNLFLKHLYDCDPGMGDVLFNDLTVLDGIHLHMMQVPEPEERKSYGTTQTGEGALDKVASKIAVPTEIKENGKPWEGGGGLPTPVAGKPKPSAKAAPAKGNGATGAPTPAAATDDDIKNAAIAGVTNMLEKQPSGVPRMLLQTQVLNDVTKTMGKDMSDAVGAAYFKSVPALDALLAEVGYAVQGAMVKPVV
jgi:hypothetical protein